MHTYIYTYIYIYIYICMYVCTYVKMFILKTLDYRLRTTDYTPFIYYMLNTISYKLYTIYFMLHTHNDSGYDNIRGNNHDSGDCSDPCVTRSDTWLAWDECLVRVL